MNWTTIPYGTSSQDRLNKWEAWYNATTYFKVRYAMSNITGGRVFTSTDNCSVLTFSTATSGIGQLIDNTTNTAHCDFAKEMESAEFVLSNGVEFYAIRQKDDPSKWLVNVIFAIDNDNTICIHSGADRSANILLKTKTTKDVTMLDMLSFTTACGTFNNSYGNDYIIQPLYIYDEATSLYLISGNTELAVFTVIQVQTKKFMIVGKGICIEVE